MADKSLPEMLLDWERSDLVRHSRVERQRSVAPEMSGAARDADRTQTDIARSAALRACHVLDTPLLSRFDAFTRLASQIFGTSMAGISLLDERRQWFKSTIGFSGGESPRKGSFCDAAVQQSETLLIVRDARLDPRFAGSPAVTGAPRMRFYAGLALRSLQGQPLGAFFIADEEPRDVGAEQIALLADLAAGVEAVLALHESVVALGNAVNTDYLTGLLNRGPFELRLEEEVGRAEPGQACAVLCLDVDGFKQINDAHGHGAGDAVLVEAARRLHVVVRSTDLVARLSGDEIAILMRSPVRLDDARLLAERVIATFRTPIWYLGSPIAVRVSMGAAFCPDDATTAAQLMHQADMALYQAKQAGGNRYEVLDPFSERQLACHRRMEADLRLAVAEGGFDLHWQPIVAATGGAVRGYEVLLRWNQPGRGCILPGDFVPLAERCGLIAAIDSWVINEACRQAASLPDELMVGVNVWAGWFTQGKLRQVVQSALAASGLAAHRLEIEVTERVLIDNNPEVLGEMLALKALGVRLALDDFGTGYSSLGYLSTFPFDTLKLDRSFVESLCVNPRSRSVASAVLRLGHELGMLVCAEGVETQEQIDILVEGDCDLLQGFLIGRPGGFPGS